MVVAASLLSRNERLRSLLLRKFPRHLLGAVPLLFSWELAADRRRDRRTWSSMLNAFLHPAMERFLYQRRAPAARAPGPPTRC